jgi:hypothetical protein
MFLDTRKLALFLVGRALFLLASVSALGALVGWAVSR